MNPKATEDNFEENEFVYAPPPGVIVEGNHIHIKGLTISIFDPPSCLLESDEECAYCEFFDPEDCILLDQEGLLIDIQSLFQLMRDRYAKYIVRSSQVVNSIYHELSEHGRPLHYSTLTKIVSARHPDLILKEWTILRIVDNHPDLFENVGDGVIKTRQGSQIKSL